MSLTSIQKFEPSHYGDYECHSVYSLRIRSGQVRFDWNYWSYNLQIGLNGLKFKYGSIYSILLYPVCSGTEFKPMGLKRVGPKILFRGELSRVVRVEEVTSFAYVVDQTSCYAGEDLLLSIRGE